MDITLERFIPGFSTGKCSHAGDFLGAHRTARGTIFRVWAPEAVRVNLAGDFNGWSPTDDPMIPRAGGIWELARGNLPEGTAYKYAILSKDGQTLWKTDPYGTFAELRPASASRLYTLSLKWTDEDWLAYRRAHKVYDNPLNIYEVHFGSFKNGENGPMTFREAADLLLPYVKDMGFTHIEFMPLTEFPYDGSWGYQCTGYFAATSRFGTPEDLMYLIDACHRAGLGVIMDWVPAHFPKDPQGLVEFDGSRLYENRDPEMAEHPSWGTRIFDYGRGEVKSFLISSALFWLEKYHIDGLRVDAVASMLYLDYDRSPGHWKPNKFGSNENLEAVEFLQQLNAACFGYDDSILMIAEESTAWPMVTRPADAGGLGFNLKWNMGWMNDTLRYLKTDPYFRAGCHNDLTFSLMYAFSENFVLPLSHDEVVHMKGSLLEKVPGTGAQKLSTVRALWAYMLAHPGKKLLFMGAELGQPTEWNYEAELPWALLDQPENASLHDFFRAANVFYNAEASLWELDFESDGFQWICPDESIRNILSFTRRDKKGHELLFAANFSGVTAEDFRLGVTGPGTWKTVFSTDEKRFGGAGALCEGTSFETEDIPHHDQSCSIVLDIPPLSAIFIQKTRASTPPDKKRPSERAKNGGRK